MAHWLLKEEPTHFSFEDLKRAGETVWEGVRNPLALIHIRKMKKGDTAFYYHTGSERAVVGLATITSDPFPDPGGGDPRLVVVKVKADRLLPEAVGLAAMKANPALAGFDLLRISRLSIVPVGDAQWKEILRMAGGARRRGRAG